MSGSGRLLHLTACRFISNRNRSQFPADCCQQCPQLYVSAFGHNQPDKPLLAIHGRENGKAVIAFEQEAEQADAVGSDAEKEGVHDRNIRKMEAGEEGRARLLRRKSRVTGFGQTFSEASTPPSRSLCCSSTGATTSARNSSVCWAARPVNS